MCEPGPASSRFGLVSCCPSGVPVMC
jgi:hypothetical protein